MKIPYCHRITLVLIAILFTNMGLALPSAQAAETQTMLIGDTKFECAQTTIVPVDEMISGKWNFNSWRVAAEYGIYAAASYDVYEPQDDDEPRAFHIADNDPALNGSYGKTGWIRAEPRHKHGSGLAYDVYYHDTPERLDVMTVYRGTDSPTGMDLIANLSWVTQWFNPWDQYRQARNDYKGVMERAITAANGKPIAFVATGHSLGGGLAQHVAYIHPCTTVLAFNPSFVTNTLFYGSYKPLVMKIFEEGDGFELLTPAIFNNQKFANYSAKLTQSKGLLSNHNIERLAAGLLRHSIDCKANKSTTDICPVTEQQLTISRTLFCDRYIKSRYDRGDKKISMAETPDFCPSHKDL